MQLQILMFPIDYLEGHSLNVIGCNRTWAHQLTLRELRMLQSPSKLQVTMSSHCLTIHSAHHRLAAGPRERYAWVYFLALKTTPPFSNFRVAHNLLPASFEPTQTKYPGISQSIQSPDHDPQANISIMANKRESWLMNRDFLFRPQSSMRHSS